MKDIDITLNVSEDVRKRARKLTEKVHIDKTNVPPGLARYFVECGAIAALQSIEGKVLISRELYEFLMGSGELEGKWVGDLHSPHHWWRKHLRQALEDMNG